MSPAGRRLLSLFLFLSGGASLILEVAWSRHLSLALGNSHQAVATVVASMMTGLFLGSLLAARALPRIRRLSRAYGLLEMGIGGYAALTPLLFKILPGVLLPLYGLPSGAFLLLRFLLVFALLLPPAAGMGATLPMVTAALTRGGRKDSSGGSGSTGGRLYGLNTLGAFVGTMAGGFLLLPHLGLLRSTLLGAATSLTVGTMAWLLSDTLLRGQSAEHSPETRPEPPSPADGTSSWILPLYAVSGSVAMIYEITWTRALAPIVGASVYSFTLILAAILAGIGLGSLLLSLRRSSRVDPARGFAGGQILLSASAFGSTWGLKSFPDLMLFVASRNTSRPGAFLFWQFLLFGFIVILPAAILGALFPFASRLLGRLEREQGAEVGRVFAWNTAGSILGSFAAGFFLVETLGSEATLALASVISASLGLAALTMATGRWFRGVTGVAGACLALAIPFLIPTWDLYRMTSGITQILRDLRKSSPAASLADLAASFKAPDARVVFHREGKTSTVTVIREWTRAWLRVDGKTDASSTPEDMITQILLGQVPFFFTRDAGRACVIGYGSGVTSHAVLTHPVRSLDTIEIERQVIEASPFFNNVNFHPLDDSRSRLILDDARTALAYRSERYDVIISEPSNPWMAGVNNLFTSEFYSLVRRRLNPGGVFCQWVQSYEMSSETLHIILNTLASSFPHTHLFSSLLGGDMILLASDRPLALVPGAEDFFRDRPRVAEDLARIGVREISDLAILYTAPVPPPAPGATLNTDDNSIIQYRAPLELLRGVEPDRMITTASSALESLFFPGVDERTALRTLGQAAERRGGLATVEAIAGVLEEKGFAPEGKDLRDRAEAMKKRLNVEDQVNSLLLLADSQGRARSVDAAVASLKQAQDLGIHGADQASRAGYILLNIGRYAEAEKMFDEAVADPTSAFYYQCLAARGAVRYRLGRRGEGTSDILAAKTIDPKEPLAYLLFGMALFDAGDREAAFRELRQGLAIAPDDERLAGTLQYLSSLPAPAPPPARP
jgi:spermidine synthase